MDRNQYDTDVTTWSPQGRLFQVEYAKESIVQGSCSLGLVCNKEVVVLAALKRNTHEMSSYQEKIFKIDSHVGVAVSGLTSDARALATYMRRECLNYKYSAGMPFPSGRLVAEVADMHHSKTTASWRRPYGVGLVIAAYDSNGPHLYETDPSGQFFEFRATALGSRAQSARTYLEKYVEEFETCGVDEGLIHALKALQGPANQKPLTIENVSLAIVGKNRPFEMVSGTRLAEYLELAFPDAPEDDAAAAEATAEDLAADAAGEAAMDD